MFLCLWGLVGCISLLPPQVACHSGAFRTPVLTCIRDSVPTVLLECAYMGRRMEIAPLYSGQQMEAVLDFQPSKAHCLCDVAQVASPL